jgi:hypothetical protein
MPFSSPVASLSPAMFPTSGGAPGSGGAGEADLMRKQMELAAEYSRNQAQLQLMFQQQQELLLAQMNLLRQGGGGGGGVMSPQLSAGSLGQQQGLQSAAAPMAVAALSMFAVDAASSASSSGAMFGGLALQHSSTPVVTAPAPVVPAMAPAPAAPAPALAPAPAPAPALHAALTVPNAFSGFDNDDATPPPLPPSYPGGAAPALPASASPFVSAVPAAAVHDAVPQAVSGGGGNALFSGMALASGGADSMFAGLQTADAVDLNASAIASMFE